MINLLPETAKKELRASQANNLLLRYLVALMLMLAIILILVGMSYFYIKTIENQAKDATSRNKANQSEVVSKLKEINEFKEDLKTSKQVLDKQINYSSMLVRIADLIPNGAALDRLTLDPESFGKKSTITAKVKDEKALHELKKSLQNSPYFSDVHFDIIDSSPEPNYKYSVTMSVIFNKELAQ